VKAVVLTAVPAGELTLISPVVAPLGTVVTICESELTLNGAELPLNFTLDAVEKPDPLIVTDIPTAPLAGLKELICGGEAVWSTVKALVLEAALRIVVTLMGPELALAGTVALIWVSETTEKEGDTVPLKVIFRVCRNPDPTIVTIVPWDPLAGLNENITKELFPFPLLFEFPGGLIAPAHPVKSIQTIRIGKRYITL
jgi:hypothetical protein